MRTTVSGQRFLRPAGSRGFQVYDSRVNILILPATVDPCSPEEEYDGKTFEVAIVALRADAVSELPHAERQFRDVIGDAGGTVSQIPECHVPINPTK
jgi:hypothetical protein